MFEAFSVGPFLIWTRVIFLLLGIWLSVEFFIRLAESANLSLLHFREHGAWYLIAFLLMGRIVSIIGNYRAYLKDILRIFVVWDGGFSYLGGAIGIAIVIAYATRGQRATFLQWLDVLLPATSFGMAFEWLGKFFAGQAYGKPTNMFWGVTYDTLSVRYVVPIHPVQLYFAFTFFLLTFLLLIVRKRSRRAGAETLVGILSASLITFCFEYFRGDFTIPVFATKLDLLVLVALFLSLGVFAAIERTLSVRAQYVYQAVSLLLFMSYFIVRASIGFPTFELRFSQFLAILAVLATVVYVVIHRLRHPYL